MSSRIQVCIPEGVFILIISQYLEFESTLRMSETCIFFNILSNSQIIWKLYCQKLWESVLKDHNYHSYIFDIICNNKETKEIDKNEGNDIEYKSLFFRSILSSKLNLITYEDTINFTWDFRFKEYAGEDWTSQCSWHKYEPANIVRFDKSGDMIRFNTSRALEKVLSSNNNNNNTKELIINNDGVEFKWQLNFKNHRTTKKVLNILREKLIKLIYLMISTSGRTNSIVLTVLENILINGINKNESLPLTNLNLRSCDVSSFLAKHITLIHSKRKLNAEKSCVRINCNEQVISEIIRNGLIGDSVRLYVQGVAVPLYCVFRSPLRNWGYLLESCWALYTSWELPIRGTCLQLEDEQLNVDVDDQAGEVDAYNEVISQGWLYVSESDEEEDINNDEGDGGNGENNYNNIINGVNPEEDN